MIGALSAELLFALSATAQQAPPQASVDRATYEVDRLGKKAEKALRQVPRQRAPQLEEIAPPQKDEKQFLVTKIKLIGCESYKPEDFAPLVSKLENKNIALSQLERLCKQIERDYLKRGVIAVVFVPPQDIKGGEVTLRVVEARMGILDVAKHPWFNSKRLHSYWIVDPGEVLDYYKISRSIQRMSKNPDREVKVALHAGKKPGTTDVFLTPKTQFPIHGTFNFDNDGNISTGKYKTGFGVRHNNFLDYDDMFLAGYTSSKDLGGYYVYHNLPLGPGGTSLLYGMTKSEAVPRKDFATYDMRTRAMKANASIHQDLYRKDEYIGEVFAEFDAQDKWVYANSSGTLNRDRLRSIAVGGSYIIRGLGANAVISPGISQGLSIFGANPTHDPYTSRGAKPVVTKYTLGLTTRAALPHNIQQTLKFTTQFSSHKLNSSEGLSLGGLDSVRGYPPGDIIADSGFIGTLEYLTSIPGLPKDWRFPYAEKNAQEDVKPVFFLDYGYGERRGEDKEHNYVGVGAGLRINLYNQGTLRLEWAMPVGNPAVSAQRASRFYVSVNLQDNLPRELERIDRVMNDERATKMAYAIIDGEMQRPTSPLRKRLFTLFARAEEAHRNGRLEEAIALYERTVKTAIGVRRQAEEYARSALARLDELRKEDARARRYLREGNIEGALEIWNAVVEGAKPKPCMVEF